MEEFQPEKESVNLVKGLIERIEALELSAEDLSDVIQVLERKIDTLDDELYELSRHVGH